MFAPSGYISLEEIKYRFREEAERWRLATPHPDDPELMGGFDPVTAEFVDKAWQREQAYSDWLFSCFLNRHEKDLYVCDSGGNALKVSELIVQRHRLYDGPFQDDPRGWQSIIDSLSNPFTFINVHGFVVDVEHSRTVFDFDAMGPAAEAIKRIDNCPVCWPCLGKANEVDWLSVCGVDSIPQSPAVPLSPRAASVRIVENWQKNPKLTKAELKQLVAQSQSVRKFNLAWALAVEEFPALSKPGQKKRI